MADLKAIKAQAKAMNKKVKIDMSEIKKGAKVEYVPSKYMSLFTEFEDEVVKKGLEKMQKKLKFNGNNVDMSGLLSEILTGDTMEMLQKIEINQGEQIIEKFEELPTIEEVKQYFAELFGDEEYTPFYNTFIKGVLDEFKQAFESVTPPSK